MARLTRKFQKIFAGQADSDQITAFGTAKTSNPVYTSDIDQIQTDQYTQGWTPSLMSDLAPYLQDSNALHYSTTRQLAYLYQEGIAEWDASTEYGLNSLCKSGETIYLSLQNGNIGHAVTESAYWKVYGDVDNKLSTLLQALYPVGSLYITANNSCPMAALIPGSQWQIVSRGRALWGGNGSNANTTIAAGLPNLDGNTKTNYAGSNGVFAQTTSGQQWSGGRSDDKQGGNVNFNARRYNSLYGSSGTVQPPAYVVNVYRRTA